MSWLKRESVLLLISFVLPAVLWGLVSFVNHACFRTYALDLGMMNQALYQFSVGEAPQFTQGLGEPMPFLCDHFSPVLIFFIPFRWLFGSYALLVVQWLAALLTGWFLYHWALHKWKNGSFALMAQWLWLVSFGVWGAVSYDMHTNVLLACGLAAMLYFKETNRWLALWSSVLVMLLSKETGGIVAGCMAVALALEPGLSKQTRKQLGWISLFSIAGFLFTLLVWMPSQCGSFKAASHATFAHLGSSWSEIAWSAITHPWEVIRLFFERPDGTWARTKVVSWIVILLSGGWACWSAPRYLILLIPLIALRFLSSNPLFWDVHAHYSVEVSVVLVLFWMHALIHIQSMRARLWFSLVSVVFCGFISWRVVISRSAQSNFFSLRHYESELILSRIDEIQGLIGQDPVSASSSICPHLAERSQVMAFPNIGGARWLVLDAREVACFPLTAADYRDRVQELRIDSTWIEVNSQSNVILLQRRFVFN